MKKNNLIYTPKHKIPIGERMVTETGQPAIRVKKGGKEEFEILTVGQFVDLICCSENNTSAESRSSDLRGDRVEPSSLL